MTNVLEEIVEARGGLRTRASVAWGERKARIEAEHSEERGKLIHDAYYWMIDQLEMSNAEVQDVSFEPGMYNPDRPKVSFEIDGLKFQARYKRETIAEFKSESFKETEKVYEDTLVVEIKKGSGSLKIVHDLAQLGEVLSS